jgi:hypothetical protein
MIRYNRGLSGMITTTVNVNVIITHIGAKIDE